MVWQIVCVAAASFLTAVATTATILPLLRRRGILDVPNDRSSHMVPTPRGGGIGVVLGLTVGCSVAWAFGMPVPSLSLFGGVILVAVVGLADDLSGGLPAGLRLLVQVVAALLVVGTANGPLFPGVGGASLLVVSILAAVLWIVGVTNIFNFLDGIDGFAGAQAVSVAICLAASGSTPFAVVFLGVAAAAVGFLVFNWHPARIFLGDVGSYAVGFFFAAVPFQAEPSSRFSCLFFVIIGMWFFLFDGSWTLMRRLVRREKVWEAHREHLYQRLVRAGYSHSQVAGVLGIAMVVLGLGSVVLVGLLGGGGYAISALIAGISTWAYVLVVRRAEDSAAVSIVSE